MKHVFRYITVLGTILFAANAGFAQDQVGISLGAGFAVRELFPGVSQDFSVSYNSDSFELSARFVKANRIRGILTFNGPQPYLDNFQEYSLNVGYIKQTGAMLYAAHIGLGQLRGKYNEERNNASFETLCVPITGQVLWRLAEPVAIGPTASLNLNGKETFVGIWFNVRMGFQI